MNISNINWDVISSIVTTIMAILAGATLWISYKQRRDDLRARLLFEVISWEGLFLLKVSNVGKEPAYSVRLNITGAPIEENYSNNTRKIFEELKKRTIVMAPGKSIYFMLSNVYGNSIHKIGNESFSSEQVNKWLDANIDKKIQIVGSYCGKYKIKEAFTIQNFIGYKSIMVHSNAELALMELSKGISCKNNFHRPIQERIDDIQKIVGQINKSK